MEFLLKWMALAGLQSAAAISPGPAFVIQVKATLAHGRSYGLYSALGLAIGVAIYAFAVMAGLAVILASTEWVLVSLRYIGAAYLIYIGYKGLTAKKTNATPALKDSEIPENQHISAQEKWQAFYKALSVQLLNPKALIFFTAVFAQFITPGSPLWVLALYWLTVTAVEYLWWVTLTLILTHPRIKAQFTKISHWIERICGGLLTALGIRLVLP